jgi:metal-responsive CopG/Arc/MetJ family transcriptional regulator
MSTKTFNLSLPKALLEKLDKWAKIDYSSRSEYIRKAIVSQMRTEEALESFFDRANKRGAGLGITSEQQVYDIIADK